MDSKQFEEWSKEYLTETAFKALKKKVERESRVNLAGLNLFQCDEKYLARVLAYNQGFLNGIVHVLEGNFTEEKGEENEE
jgi:hypothetical protein